MIKKLEKNDWQKFKQIRLEALKKSPDSFLSSFEKESKIADEFWLEQLDQDIIFGYFTDNEIVGCCGLLLEKKAKIAHTATLVSMYVKDKTRGSGIGLELVNAVKIVLKITMSKIYILVVMQKILVRLNFIESVPLKFMAQSQITVRLAINFMMI